MAITTIIFKSLAVIGASAALSAPVVYGVMQPEKDKILYLFKEYKSADDEKSIEQMETVKHPYANLIKGDKSYNDGNYVVYIGSQFCPYCNLLLYGERDISSNNYDEYNIKASMLKWSNWQKSFEYGGTNGSTNLGKSLKFVMFSDSLKTEDTSKQVLPWKTRSDDAGNVNNYIRYDESAINFRKIRDIMRSVMPKEKTQFLPTVIFYKEGRPYVLNYDKFKGIEDSDQAWDKVYPKVEGVDKPVRVHNKLVEFMYYLYKKNEEPEYSDPTNETN